MQFMRRSVKDRSGSSLHHSFDVEMHRTGSRLDMQIATERRRPLLRTALIIPIALLAVSCADQLSESESIGGGNASPAIGRDCVDGYGNNSTVEELVYAAQNTPSQDVGGRQMSQAELAREFGQEIVTDRTLDYYADVPEGGDAAYAKAVCGLEFTWSLPIDTDEHRDRIAQSPHYIRSQGRYLCKLFEGREQTSRSTQSGANIFYEGTRKSIGEIKANPESARQQEISVNQQFSESLGSSAMTVSNNAASTVAWLQSLSAEDYIGYREQELLEGLAAVTHLCPQFGPLDW